MRRRREDILKDDLREALKSEAKGFFGTIIKLFLAKIVEIITKILIKKEWVDVSDDLVEEKLKIVGIKFRNPKKHNAITETRKS